MMGLKQSYFALPDLRGIWQRLRHPFRHGETVQLDGRALKVEWTARAQRALRCRSAPLLAEMQLYFSCVVQKRVLFHDSGADGATPVTEALAVTFRPVQSQSCDPTEFAAKHPVRRTLDSPAAARMRPSRLRLDYRRGRWDGSFQI